MNIKIIISILLGGFIGGILRYLLSQLFNIFGILVANLVGCFLLAFITYYLVERGRLTGWLNAGIGTGFIGAFTTFSSLITITIKLSSENLLAGLAYLLVSAIGGILMASLGFLLANQLEQKRDFDD